MQKQLEYVFFRKGWCRYIDECTSLIVERVNDMIDSFKKLLTEL